LSIIYQAMSEKTINLCLWVSTESRLCEPVGGIFFKSEIPGPDLNSFDSV